MAAYVRKSFAKLALLGVILCGAHIIHAQRSKPAQPASLRTLSIASEPGALVIIDGVRYGKTSEDGKLNIRTVAPGRHEIRVRADGFKEALKILPATQKGEIKIELLKTSDEAELAFQEAERLSGSDREKAAEGYLKATRLRPKYVEAFIGLARVYSEGGKIESAEKAIRDVRKIRPGFPEASAIQGRIYKDTGDEGKAIKEFKKAIAEGKGFQPEAYTGLGILYKERAEGAGAAGDYDTEALNYAESAKNFAVAVKQLSGAPDALVIYQLLGLVYEQQKKYKEAIAVYEEFLAIFPESPETEAVKSFIVQLRKQMKEEQ